MAYWGTEIKSGKPYTFRYDEKKGRLHVSQATLGDGLSKGKTVVTCNVGDKKPIYLCSLFSTRMETCPLNLDFAEFEEVTLSVIGPHSVHISGYFLGVGVGSGGGGSVGVGVVGVGGDSNSESFDYDSEEEACKSGVGIQEITSDDKPVHANETDLSKNNDAASVPVLESVDEDGFPVPSSPAESGLISSKEEFIEKGTSGQVKRKKNKGDSDSDSGSGDDTNNAKRKKDDSVKDGN